MKKAFKTAAVILAAVLVVGSAGAMVAGAMPAPGPDMWGYMQQPANAVSILYVNPINDYINVRSQPAHNSALVDTVSLFECMFFTGEAGTGLGSDNVLHFWYKIRTPRGMVGWVRDDLVSIVPQNMGMSYIGDWGSSMILYVNPINDYINVRMKPDHNSGLAGVVYTDEFMYFYGATDLGYGSDGKLYFWYNITSQSGVTGWVRSDLVSISGDQILGSVWDSSANYNNRARTTLAVGAGNDYLNIRSWPQHDSALAGIVYNYEVMYFYGQTGIGYGSDNALHEWYYITTSSGVSGWVRSDLVTVR